MVGVVRDESGRPVEAARVEAFDSAGRADGSDETERSGTFAIAVPRPPSRVRVSCRYCMSQSLPVGADPEPLIVIVVRYPALADRAPTQRDLAVLPYRRPSDAAGLAPYVIPLQQNGAYGSTVSDRGLDLGYGLVLDEGMPAYDLSGEVTAFSIVPDRLAQRIDVRPAADAFRYGAGAGGGTFGLDARGELPKALAADVGPNGTLAGYARLDGFTPSAGESRDADDGAVRRRAALEYETPFAGGVLRATAVDAAQAPQGGSWTTAANESLLHLAYATASRRYVTLAEAGASLIGLQDSPVYGGATTLSTSVVAGLRVEHPATIATAFGVAGARYTGLFSAPYNPQLNSWQSTNGAYIEAGGGGTATTFHAALALWQAGLETISDGYRLDGGLTALLPSLSVRQALGERFALRASLSDSFRPATLGELFGDVGITRSGFERGVLRDTGIEYDDGGRFRIDAMLFRERLSGFVDRRTTGIGAAIAWQISPLLSLRAWTLHDAAQQTRESPSYLPYTPLALSRGVAWFSYDNPRGLRLDAVVHRDLSSALPETDVDADVVVPLARGLAATAGTARVAGKRSLYVGLRIP